MKVVGIDIGGAHLKAADSDGQTAAVPFPIWETPEQLKDRLQQLLRHFSNYGLLAVTMTAELADCFGTKPEGVDFILNAVQQIAEDRPVYVWQTGAEFVTVEVARSIPYLVAAANWHALATWIGRLAPAGNSLLIDIGSTTTDIIPLLDGIPVPVGLTDRERLQSGELVYTGTCRTPVCAVARAVPLTDGECQLAAELFATTQDVYLLMGKTSERAAADNSADGRPATIQHAHQRLAHMCCCDAEELSLREAKQVAQYLMNQQLNQLQAAVDQVIARTPGGCQTVLISCSGSFLAEQLIEKHTAFASVPTIDVSSMFSAQVAESACAFALAMLGLERIDNC